jgi:F-type H+-transporting ATPase subunit epsilon
VPFDLTIVTPDGLAYQGSVERVVLPGSEGDFGVLASHERFLSSLRVGEVEIRTAGDTLYAAIAGGFAEVDGDAVSVLVDSCELEHEIDAARADAALIAAQQALERVAGDEDPARYRAFETALDHARARVAVSQRKRK